jgi:drug/metabolite transporter (DMT)-like permease
MPPFTMASLRFLIAGFMMYAWLRLRGEPAPASEHWRAALPIGFLLLAGGNGSVSWAEQWVNSSIAALIVAITPLWGALIPWIARRAKFPGPVVIIGTAIGLAGVGVLVTRPEAGGHAGADGGRQFIGTLVLLFASLCWAGGSLWSKELPQPENPFMTSALQMLCGGACLMVIAAIAGEFSRVNPSAVSTRSALAFIYLVTIGAIGGFSAFVWLMKWTKPVWVFTYAYVNPLVAVILGWAIGGEEIGTRTLAAAGLIVVSVAVIVTAKTER